jgi:hypothetical protein
MLLILWLSFITPTKTMELISAADLDVTNLETNDVQVLTRDNGFGKPERDTLLALIA